ncbi:MAG: hypothetical protein O3B35_04245 [Proteobacteria bacterium]|nr:hypothetical protein [Pseudomonadota bacterium]
MLTNSNLYAERVFAEHPLALWPLDDDISFLQLFDGEQQNLSASTNWIYPDLTEISAVDYSDTPISISPSTRLSLSSSAVFTANITSLFTLNSTSDFDGSKSTACFSTHVYQGSVFVDSFTIGVSYDGIEDSTLYTFGADVGWHNISHTFDLPENKNLTFFIRIDYSDSGSTSDLVVQFNGMSLGQWSEQYIQTEIGFNDVDFPGELEHLLVSGSGYRAVEVDAYTLDTSLNGYYLIKNKQMFAQTSGIPMVFGSNHTTKITEAQDGNPSIVMPGRGFLNEAGKYNDYTLEAWIRLDNISADPIKIIGPIKSNDGIYVEEGFISLRIGSFVRSYYVGKWYRPMLVHFKYSPTEANLLINGEQVISMPIDIAALSFPAQEDSSDNNQDWLGIYGNDLISPFEIDCVSIYPYLIPLEMAKRRFVYGQGVDNPNLSNEDYLVNSYLFDYGFSDYSANSLYPDVNSWRNGFSINLDTTSTYMTTPAYTLPTVQLKRGSRFLSLTEWYQENKQANTIDHDQYPYLMMKPLYERERFKNWNEIYNSGITRWNNINEEESWYEAVNEFFVNEDILYSDVSIYYENINILTERLESVVGVFRSPESPIINQPLMYFENKSTGESINVELDLNWLKYIYISPTGTQTILNIEPIDNGEYFVAGFNLSRLQNQKYSVIGKFFASLDSVTLNIGGYLDSSFGGRIYAIHFNNGFFFQKDLADFFNNSFVKQLHETQNVAGELIEYTANYSLLPSEKDSIVDLDIGATGYWEDFQPLSFFGKYVVNEQGEEYYDLDMLQFNIDVPKRSEIDEQLNAYLTYGALDLLYATYADLSNILLTGYANYQELKEEGAEDVTGTRFDTSVTAYLTFQKYFEAGNKAYSEFTNIQEPTYNNVVEFNSSEFDNTKYEVLDNTIIFPPKTPDFKDYYLGMHLEVKVRNILSRKLLLRRMEIASLAFDNSAPYAVGTKESNDVFPFTRTNFLFNYKQKNPFTIYKDSSPYLYLTEYSGIYVNPFESEYDRGVLLPINKEKQPKYQVGGIQFWSRYPLETMPTVPFRIMKIRSDDINLDFYIQPESNGERGKLIAYDFITGQEFTDLIFYQDGREMSNPYIYPRQWSAINISFLEPLEFNNITGRIEMYSGMVFNNIGEYNYAQPLNEISKSLFKRWFQVYSNVETETINTWGQITRPLGFISDRTWGNATTTFVQNQYTIDGESEYNKQVGLAISVTDDLSSMSIYSNGSDVFTDVTWQKFEVIPV